MTRAEKFAAVMAKVGGKHLTWDQVTGKVTGKSLGLANAGQ